MNKKNQYQFNTHAVELVFNTSKNFYSWVRYLHFG